MDAEIKAKWLTALRSGRYKQAQNKLRDGEAYCCLGVLAKELDLPITPDGMHVKYETGNGSGYRPIWNIVGEYASRDLAVMNDGGDSFADIANYIEKNL